MGPDLELEDFQALLADARQEVEAWRSVGVRSIVPSPPLRLEPDEPRAPEPRTPQPESRAPQAEPWAARPIGPPRAVEPQPRAVEPPPRTIVEPTRPVLDSAWASYSLKKDPAAELRRIREELGECKRCGLAGTRTNLVFGAGSPTADLLIAGEAPGEEEDQSGQPFVGAAGQMLDRMITNVLGIKREEAYILNVLKCRPPGNRDPNAGEVQMCKRFFDAQIAAIRPRVILCLGRYATQTLLGTTEGIRSLRGGWKAYQGIDVMPTYHPAYLLRLQEPALTTEKRAVFNDLLKVKERLAAAP